jgi:hypothetical protein
MAGWAAVAEALEACPRLASLNGIACAGLVTGGLTDLRLGELEEGLAAGLFRFLARSGGTLTALDLRRALPALSDSMASTHAFYPCLYRSSSSQSVHHAFLPAWRPYHAGRSTLAFAQFPLLGPK